ncbi:hypothetical protein LOTGIDRAFT_174155 [Lottia gigantea]|uniref:Uncharacterized protein n=1 Tax=Lottia gigantea TaxID=225164 RepID=V4AUF0_LOTGI|nr:hypothetical protein LOTGIDRAFT_174155 [Lottia gigantea]ESO98560.1 hypothetical protein LOTGIDRAFT_174155 [Lottia gigantea]
MSWKPVDSRSNSHTNVPDYEKMLHNPHYSGWGEKEDNVHPVRSRSPPTSQYHPENTTHEPRIYQPSKYNLVSGGGSHYDSTYRDYSAPTREGTVQYLSSDGYEKVGHKTDYGFKTLPSYQSEVPHQTSSYSGGHNYRTLPLRSNPNDLVYRTPVKSSIHEERNHPPAQGYVHRDDHPGTSLHSTSNLRHSTGDLRHWQQLHQEQLLHQHIETQALYDKPASVSIDNLFKQLSLKEEDVSRWEPIRRAADGIIQEKNMIIEKLKNRILQLEEDCSLNETRLKHALINQDDTGDTLHHKIQFSRLIRLIRLIRLVYMA